MGARFKEEKGGGELVPARHEETAERPALGLSWQEFELARPGLFSISMKAEAEPLGGQVLAHDHGARGWRAAIRTPGPGRCFPPSDGLSGGRQPHHSGRFTGTCHAVERTPSGAWFQPMRRTRVF